MRKIKVKIIIDNGVCIMRPVFNLTMNNILLMQFTGKSLRDTLPTSNFGRKTMGGVSYREIEESTGLLESGSSEDEDEEVRMINGFDTALPLSDQITMNLSGKITRKTKT